MSEDKTNDEQLSAEDSKDESESGSSRRRMLKGIAASGAVIAGQEVLPDKWSKPLVDAVVLPAHAQATGASTRTTDDDEAATDDESSDITSTDDVGSDGSDGTGGSDDQGSDRRNNNDGSDDGSVFDDPV